jgi:hypothetical protein
MGFTHPTELLPAVSRAAFTRDIIAATTGADADVPYRLYKYPPMSTK